MVINYYWINRWDPKKGSAVSTGKKGASKTKSTSKPAVSSDMDEDMD
jgi:hypothetical protein